MLHLELTTTQRTAAGAVITGCQTTQHTSGAACLARARDCWHWVGRRHRVALHAVIRDDAGRPVTRWEWRRA
jgi:hypothetical protein